MRTQLIAGSYHHGNTLKLAHVMAEVMHAAVVTPTAVVISTLSTYELIGLGTGIYSAAHHPQLLQLADDMPQGNGAKVFIFSTDGTPRRLVKDEARLRSKMHADHAALRRKLEAKGYTVIAEFNCAGYNTNKFLKLFGGLNQGRPNEEDFRKARAFATDLMTAEHH